MIRKFLEFITNQPFSITDTDPDYDTDQSSQTSILSQTNIPLEDDNDCVRGYDDASLQQRVQAVVEMEFENKHNVILTPNDSLDPFQTNKMQKKKKEDRTFYQDLLQQTNTYPQTDTFTDPLRVHVLRDEHVNHENNRKRSRSPDDHRDLTTFHHNANIKHSPSRLPRYGGRYGGGYGGDKRKRGGRYGGGYNRYDNRDRRGDGGGRRRYKTCTVPRYGGRYGAGYGGDKRKRGGRYGGGCNRYDNRDHRRSNDERRRQKYTIPNAFKQGIALIREEQTQRYVSEFSGNSRKRTIDFIADDEPPKKKAKRSPCVTPTPRHHLKLYRIKDASPKVSSCCNIKILSKQKERYLATYSKRLNRIYGKYNMAKQDNIPKWMKKFGGDVDKLHQLYTNVCAKYDLIPFEKYEGYSEALVDPNEMEVSKDTSLQPIPIQQPHVSTPQPQTQPQQPPLPTATIPLPMPPSASIIIHSDASPESEKSVSLHVPLFQFTDTSQPQRVFQSTVAADTSWMDNGPAMFTIPIDWEDKTM